MDDPGAGSSAGGPPAGAVVVLPIEAAAAPAARRPAWTRVRARVTWAGAAAGALVARVASSATAAARTRLTTARLAWAAALFLLGCAAAGLACFAMILPPSEYSRHLMGKACAPPTDAEVADLRTASEYLLLAASAQVLAATMGLLLVPARPVAFFGWLLGFLTAYRAAVVLWMLVACHGSVHGALAFHFWFFYVVLLVTIAVGAVVSSIC